MATATQSGTFFGFKTWTTRQADAAMANNIRTVSIDASFRE
jgi:hypothetical protein